MGDGKYSSLVHKKYPSLAKWYKDTAQEFVERCTYCGECLDNCLIYPLLTSINEKAHEDILQKMVNFLKGGDLSDEVYLKAFSCGSCGYCSDCCPEGIDPMWVHEATRVGIVERGKEPPEATNFVIPGQRMNIYEILSAIQTKPSEERWLKSMPSKPKRTENVLFIGCSGQAVPSRIFALLDVLERMGVDFVAIGGGGFCCGSPLCSALGKVEQSEETGRKLISALEAFSPKRVIFTCGGCYHQFVEFIPLFMDYDFEVQFYSDFLSRNLDKLNLTKPLGETIFFQDSCQPRRTGVGESVKKVVAAVPGLKQVDSQAICCGALTNMTYPQMGGQFGHALIEEVAKSGADYLVNACGFCRLNSYPHMRKYSFGLKDIAELINESMGGREYEDKLLKYWRCGSVEEIMEKSRENFEANGWTEEEMSKILPMLFPVG